MFILIASVLFVFILAPEYCLLNTALLPSHANVVEA